MKLALSPPTLGLLQESSQEKSSRVGQYERIDFPNPILKIGVPGLGDLLHIFELQQYESLAEGCRAPENATGG